MTTTIAQTHPPAPRWGALQIALPEVLYPAVFSSRLLFLTLLLTAALATPATAFDFLGDIIATLPTKWVPPTETPRPPGCPSEDYIYHLDSGDVVCRVSYGAPGLGAYTKLCTMDLFDTQPVHCEEESLVANISILQENVARNFLTLTLMLTAEPASEALEAMGFDGPLRLTGTAPTLDIQNTDDFYLTGADFEHRIYRGGKAIIWHEDPMLGLVQLATYDLVTLELDLEYLTLASSIVVTAVRTSGLPIFPETWTGELTGPSFTHGSSAGVFPTRIGMELESVALPSLGPLGLSIIAGMLAAAGWFGGHRPTSDQV